MSAQGVVSMVPFVFLVFVVVGPVGTGLREHLPVKEPDVPVELVAGICIQGHWMNKGQCIKSETKTMH